MSTDHEQQQENVGAYLLGALPELETELFERHLMGCEVCREEVLRLRLASDALPRSVEPLVPPETLKTSLMSIVREDAAAAAPKRSRRLLPRGLRMPGLMRLPASAAWVSAAFLLALGLSGGFGIAQLAGGDDDRTVAAEVDTLRLPGGSASMTLHDGGDDGATVSVHGLPEPTGNRVYQVWLVRGEEVAPSSLFNVRSDGSGAAALPDGLDDVDQVMVTRERKGGAKSPSERPVIVANLS